MRAQVNGILFGCDQNGTRQVSLASGQALDVRRDVTVVIAKYNFYAQIDSSRPQCGEESFWARDTTKGNHRPIQCRNLSLSFYPPCLEVSIGQLAFWETLINNHSIGALQ